MNKCIKAFKKLFPKPRLPQKRYLILIGLMAYYILKLYVIQTPTKEDDDLPDDLKGVVGTIFASNNVDSDY